MDFWKRKLAAFLHDPPHKPVRIKDHEDQRASFLTSFGLDPKEIADFDRETDWQAAAADRLIFPNPRRSKLRVEWAESWMEFRHPLGGGVLKPESFPPTAAKLEEELARALDSIKSLDADDWKQKFIAGWRLWTEFAARERNSHFAYLVADTRIPDHTLWHHNSLAAAFTGCKGNPAFLMFQIGPVQEFIAQARKTQDLWSGSYLLSYLIAQGMLAIADEIGPDAIIYPQLRGTPLADFHWWKCGFFGSSQKLRASHRNELLTPNLPNRFLALIPADWKNINGKTLPEIAAERVRNTWREIAEVVHGSIQKVINGGCPGWDTHWNPQVERFPVLDWVVHPWQDAESTLKLAEEGTPPLHGGWKKHPLNNAVRWAKEFVPPNEREAYGPDSNAAFAWALHYAVTDWKFAAHKSARTFSPWQVPGSLHIDGIPKDHLDGKNEVMGGIEHNSFWRKLREVFPDDFKGSQLYGALNVIKRLWCEAYLKDKLDLDQAKPVFQPVTEIAQVDEAIDAESKDAEKYYAVLAADGDDMGQWVSGAKAAPLVNSLADAVHSYFLKHWPTNDPPAADDVLRSLSPGYHAAFSEALANFSLYGAGPVVEAFGGQLIYAGGDDVLALLPARTALDCAQALQLTFRGLNPSRPRASTRVREKLSGLFDYSRHVDGFLTLRRSGRAHVGRAEHLKPNWPMLVMGPRASLSVGLAIGHVRSPMQDTIQAARSAEARAKKVKNKGAYCIEVIKRSGEAVGFSGRWNDGVIGVWGELEADVHTLSNRFAYRYAQLLKPLLIEGGSESGARYAREWSDGLSDAAEAELRHVLIQQGNLKPVKAREIARYWRKELIGEDLVAPALDPRNFHNFWMTWAFLSRLGEPESDPLS